MNGIGGCCGTSPEHIAAIRDMALAYPPRQRHDVPAQLRLSGLEPLNYAPDEGDMRRTFLNIGERCNVAGSIMYKKAIVDGDYDKAMQIALSQVRGATGVEGGEVQLLGMAGRQRACRQQHCACMQQGHATACNAAAPKIVLLQDPGDSLAAAQPPWPWLRALPCLLLLSCCPPPHCLPRRSTRAPTCWTSTWTMA